MKDYLQINDTEKKIPKIVHSVWLGGNKKSEIVLKCEKSWRDKLDGYRYIEWNEENFDIASSEKYVIEAFEQKKWAFVSDYIRLKVLYEYGGVYFDNDLELVKDIDSIRDDLGFVCSESKHTISTALIAAPPKAVWVQELLNQYKAISFINEDGSLNTLPNTKRFQKYFEKKFSYSWSKSIQKFSTNITIYPEEYFSPINCYTGKKNITHKTYAIHHYDNSWKKPSDKIKRKVLQKITYLIGEDTRYKLVDLKNFIKNRGEKKN